MNLKNQRVMTSSVLGWTIVGIGALFYCYEYLLRITPSVMMVPLMHFFQLPASKLGFLISLYYVAYTPAQVFVGLAHDFFGPRRVFIFAIILCVGGSFLFSSHQSIWLVGVGRFLVGLGSAFAFVGVLKLAVVWLPLNRFAMVVGLTTMLGMLMGVAGNIGVMKLFHTVGWHNTLLLISSIGVLLIFLIWFGIKDNVQEKQILQNHIHIKRLLSELLQLLKNKQVWFCGFVGSALYLSLSLFAELWGNEYISRVFHLSLMQASYLNSMIFTGWLIGSPVLGALADVTGQHKLFLILGCFVSALIALVITTVHTNSIFLLHVIFFIFGLSCSTENICFAVGRANAPSSLAASALALVNMIVMLGGMVFQPLYGHLLDLQWTGLIEHGVRVYTPVSFRIAFAVVPIILLIAGFTVFRIRNPKFDHEVHS